MSPIFLVDSIPGPLQHADFVILLSWICLRWLFALHHRKSLGGGFKQLYVHPYLGEWSNLTNILQIETTIQPPFGRIFFSVWKHRTSKFKQRKDLGLQWSNGSDLSNAVIFSWTMIMPKKALYGSRYVLSESGISQATNPMTWGFGIFWLSIPLLSQEVQRVF